LQKRISYSDKQQINKKLRKVPFIIIFSINSNTMELIYRYYPIYSRTWKTWPVKGKIVCNMSKNVFDA